MGVVGGAIQGVHDPAGALLTSELASLLGQHPVGREGSQELLPYDPLRLLVDLRDEVHLTLVSDHVFGAEASTQYFARPPGCGDCGLKFARQVLIPLCRCECATW